MEKSKKANELDKTLQAEEKLANIPLREIVAHLLCKQKILPGEPGCCLVGG